MKKILALVLAMVMMLSVAACTANNNDDTQPVETTTAPIETTAPAVALSPLEVLETVWGLFGEDEQFFVMGGDFENMVDGAPGTVGLATPDFLTGNLIVPAEQVANVTAAASLIHGMNANTFTAAAYTVADVQAFAAAMQTAIQGNHWMCGFPEKLLIASAGGNVVVAFGHTDAVGPFKAHLTEAFADAEILVDGAIG